MKRFSAPVSLALISFLAGVGVTYVVLNTAWVSDMANQPSLKAQEMPFMPPRGAVSVGPGVIHPAAHRNQPGGSIEEMESTSEDHHAEASAPDGHHHAGASPGGIEHHHDAPDEHHGSAPPAEEHHHDGVDSEVHDHDGGVSPGATGHHHDDSSPSSHDHHGGASREGDHHDDASPSAQGHHEKVSPSSSSHHHEGAALPPQSEDEHGGHEHEHGGHEHEHGMAMEHGPEIVNPVEPTIASIRRGESLFAVYCSVCHGVRGQGGKPIASKYPKIPTYTRSLLQETPDSHMFSMLTSGHGPMPGYAEALSVSDRWDVINYVRSIQDGL